ncbi:hypothetical protein TTHERM_00502550 (macronuclear) [Tetrahymena thermophila SB210]|uniref:Uncharacterized protein n=1 Tax=Tetrahymena thermophila (strain SB210) TaxID=312017 RepID=I7MGU8_TETTS|nr:hypothetical protein TTHERM_00502550 [Tetrahymena thermophila SB210]EAS02064.2 hypothetical protein TTHERM_00502550 [Tetrahymena thermophila SB210]|eukprot:XP_001022309.2 hypothetical protein TTHERM_00502550 [Tetrahymena thermophila SB210]
MISKSNYFQQGQQTIINKHNCTFGSCISELNKINKKYLNNIKKGNKTFCLLQSNLYENDLFSHYKDNPLLRELYDRSKVNKCNHLLLVEALLKNNQKCELVFFDLNMFLGNIQISRLQRPFLNNMSMISEFLEKNIIPQLKKLQIREILALKYAFAGQDKNLDEYESGFDNYLKYVIKQNIDLHLFIQYVYDILNNISDGDFNCNSVYISKDVCLLDLEPFVNVCAISIQFFNYRLREENKQYTKNNLPRITFLNLDGYDHGYINYNCFKDNIKNVQYISLFDDNIVSFEECKDIFEGRMEIENERKQQQINKETQLQNEVRLSGQKEKIISCLDTFSQMPDEEYKQKNLYQKNSIMIPLQSYPLDILTNQKEREEYQISSGKIRKVLNDIVYPSIKNFQPELVIVTYSLSMNKQSHKKKSQGDTNYSYNNFSLNEQLFSEIMTHIQIYANSKVIYCPHILKNIFQVSRNDYKSNKNYSFDEKYYFNTMQSFAFSDAQQIESMYQYQQNILGAFFQVQSLQLVEPIPKDYFYNDPLKTLTQIQFQNRMNRYASFISDQHNQNIKQYIASNINIQKQTQIMQQIAHYHKSEKLKDQFLQKYRKEYENNDEMKDENNNQIIETLEDNKMLKYNHFVYDSLQIILKAGNEEELKAQRLYFEDKEGQKLYFTQQSQYYVDYEQQVVFIFNIISDNLSPQNYYASFKEGNISEGGILKCNPLPYFFPEKLEGGNQMIEYLLEFSICIFQNYILVVYGKYIYTHKSKVISIQSLVNLQENQFKISDQILYFNFELFDKTSEGHKKDIQWQALNIQSNADKQFPERFIKTNNFGRLYHACIITDKSTSKKHKKYEPILFVFGGIKSFDSQQQSNGFSQLFCNSIIRIAPQYYEKGEENIDEIFKKDWYVSMLDKSKCITTMRPFCNSQAIEISKNKILLIGGTHNKYLIPLQNEKIFAYTFSITKETAISNESKKVQKQLKSKQLKQSKIQTAIQNERGWQLNEVEPKQFGTQFTNAALSSQNKNIFFQKDGYNVQYFIMLNQEKYVNKKIYLKLQQNHDQQQSPYCCNIQINTLQNPQNGTESNNLSANSETGKELPQTNKTLKLQLNHIDVCSLQQNNKNNLNYLPLSYFSNNHPNSLIKEKVNLIYQSNTELKESSRFSRSLDTNVSKITNQQQNNQQQNESFLKKIQLYRSRSQNQQQGIFTNNIQSQNQLPQQQSNVQSYQQNIQLNNQNNSSAHLNNLQNNSQNNLINKQNSFNNLLNTSNNQLKNTNSFQNTLNNQQLPLYNQQNSLNNQQNNLNNLPNTLNNQQNNLNYQQNNLNNIPNTLNYQQNNLNYQQNNLNNLPNTLNNLQNQVPILQNQQNQISIEKFQANQRGLIIPNQQLSQPIQQNFNNQLIRMDQNNQQSGQQLFYMKNNTTQNFHSIEQAQNFQSLQNLQINKQQSLNQLQQTNQLAQNDQKQSEPQIQNIQQQQQLLLQQRQSSSGQIQLQNQQNASKQLAGFYDNTNQQNYIYGQNMQQRVINPIYKEKPRFQEHLLNESKKLYTKIYPGSKIGLLNIVIVHLDFKQRNKIIKIEGGSFQDNYKFLQSYSENIDFQKSIFQQQIQVLQQQQQPLNQQPYTQECLQEIPNNSPKEQPKQIQTEMNTIQHNPSFGIPYILQSNFFAAQAPGEIYYQNYLYYISIADNKPIYPLKIDIKVNAKSFQAILDNDYISPEPNKIRGIYLSQCGSIFFLLYKEKQSTYHVLCCKNTADIISNKCMIFDKYIKYRTKAELYKYIKNQLTNPEFEKYDKKKQDEEKKNLQILIERQIQDFDKLNETLDFNILVDDQFIYFLSPLIIKHLKNNPPQNQLELERVQSHHIFLSYRSSQKDLEVIPQDLQWFKNYNEDNIKAAQSKKHIAMILNKIFKSSDRENEYYLKYKILNKINKQLKTQEIVESSEYTYKFRCNINIDSIKNIHQIISKSDQDKFDLIFILIENINTNYKRFFTFKPTNFHENVQSQNEIVNDIKIDHSQIFRDYIFTSLQQAKAEDYYIFDDINKSLWNAYPKSNQNTTQSTSMTLEQNKNMTLEQTLAQKNATSIQKNKDFLKLQYQQSFKDIL